MYIKNQNEIKIMRQAGRILAKILKQLAQEAKPGKNAADIEKLALELLLHYKAKPAFLGFGGYEYATCISLNNEVVHGLPTPDKIIKPGDLVKIDFGVLFKGFNTDAAVTVIVGKISEKTRKMVIATRKSLQLAIKMIRPGVKLSAIQSSIQDYIEDKGFSVVRDLAGHGIGKNLQEEPSIPNFCKQGPEITLKEGMTFCIEPMVNMGDWKVVTASDGWTVLTKDNGLSAHFEHTLLVTKNGCEILTK